jgi:hypothetical protein
MRAHGFTIEQMVELIRTGDAPTNDSSALHIPATT